MADNDEKIVKALEALQADVKDIKQGQVQTNERLGKLENGQTQTNNSLAHLTTAVDALEAGLESTKSELKVDIHDLKVKVVGKVKDHEERIEELEKAEGIPHPHKH